MAIFNIAPETIDDLIGRKRIVRDHAKKLTRANCETGFLISNDGEVLGEGRSSKFL